MASRLKGWLRGGRSEDRGAKGGDDEEGAEDKGGAAEQVAEGKDGSGAAAEVAGAKGAAAEGKDDDATRAMRSGPPFEVAAVIGCGFLGARIALEIASQQVQVRVFDRSTPAEEIQGKIRELSIEFLAGLEGSEISRDEKFALFDAAVDRVVGCGSIEEAVTNAR